MISLIFNEGSRASSRKKDKNVNRQLTEEKMQLVKPNQTQPLQRRSVRWAGSTAHSSSEGALPPATAKWRRSRPISLRHGDGVRVDGVAFSGKSTFFALASSQLGLSYRMKAPAFTCTRVFV